MKPHVSEYPAYYHRYIESVGDDDVRPVFTDQVEYFTRLMSTMTDEDALFRYAEGKWSVKQVLGHLIDCERVFAYRAMCIARGETQALPGFDENAYVANASFDQRPIAHILDEFVAVRLGTILLYDSLSSVEQLLSGVANNNPVTVRSLMWIIAGHTQHHLRILEEKYGVTSDK
ncbi:MAG: DinB family protein [Bacteroidota bacterium]|jgi:uncharacterized damage-inducible protein DinB